MILLVAMVGAIVLTLRQREGVKRQDIAPRMRAPETAIEVVKVKSGQGSEPNCEASEPGQGVGTMDLRWPLVLAII